MQTGDEGGETVAVGLEYGLVNSVNISECSVEQNISRDSDETNAPRPMHHDKADNRTTNGVVQAERSEH